MRFVHLRSFIRRRFCYFLYNIVYDPNAINENGIAPILEIIGAIVNGLEVPVKIEWQKLFLKSILPLHKLSGFNKFSNQLVHCTTQFVEKEVSLALPAIAALLKFWPTQNAQKEIAFIDELECILQLTNHEQFEFFMVCSFSLCLDI